MRHTDLSVLDLICQFQETCISDCFITITWEYNNIGVLTHYGEH